jgi:hypothetical protein
MKIYIPIMIFISLYFNGCTIAQQFDVNPNVQYETIGTENRNNSLGTIFVWDNDKSAAVIYRDHIDKEQSICMQNAMVANSIDSNATTKLTGVLSIIANATTDYFSLAKAGKLDSNSSQNTKDIIELNKRVTKTVNQLFKQSQASTYLNVGMFYVCQLSANRVIDENQTKDIVMELIKTSMSLENNSTN